MLKKLFRPGKLTQWQSAMFLLSPVIALGTGIVGFILAHHFDFLPAQMTVALLNLFLCLAWFFRRYR